MKDVIIHEWDIKFDNNNLPYAYIKNNILLDSKIFNDNFETMEFNDIRNVYTMLVNAYDINHLTEEYGIIIAFRANKLLGTYILSKGTDLSCDVNLRIIYRFLLLIGANSFIFEHNHPLGGLKMSEDDIKVTKILMETSELMDFEFINHILIADNDWLCLIDEIRENEV